MASGNISICRRRCRANDEGGARCLPSAASGYAWATRHCGQHTLRHRWTCRWQLMIALLLAMNLPPLIQARAQPVPSRAPASTHIFPAGGRRGSTVQVRVGAECLPPGANFFLTGEGVGAPHVLGEKLSDQGEPSPRRLPTEVPISYPKQWSCQIEIADHAPLATVFWRLSCAQGGTASRPFVIGDLPEFIESESNSSPQRAEPVALPASVNGQINGERDVDYFRFTAGQGELVTCEVMAGRLGSRLDPIVEIVDLAGRRLNTDSIYVGSDPVLAFCPDSAGDYLLRISNVSFRGDPAHVYRINLTRKPFVTYAFPAGGQAGAEVDLELSALSGTGQPRIYRRKLRVPDGSAGPFLLRDPQGELGPVAFTRDRLPSRIEREPNESPDAAELVSWPLTLHGRFASNTDEDWFEFQAQKDDRLEISCQSSSRGGGALPVLSLRDAAGSELAQARSVDSPHGRCLLQWQAPSSGTYRLRLRDLRQGARGGLDLIYRLTMERAPPDFSLSLDSDIVNVLQGSKSPLEISVQRRGGFEGEVELQWEGLPEGVKLEPAKIPAQAARAKLSVAAEDHTPCGSWALRLVGRARIGDQDVVRVAHAAHQGRDPEGVSVGPTALDQLHLTVQHKPQFRLYCSEAYLYAHRGSVFPYLMEVERLDGFNGEITLQIGDRQNRDLDGIEMFEVVIPPGETQTRLPIYLPETMHINVQSQSQLYCQGYAIFKDQSNRSQSLLVVSEKRNMLRTMPPVVKLKAVEEQLSATRGDQVTCHLRLERTANFPGPMQLQLWDAPVDVKPLSESVHIAPAETEAQFKLLIGKHMQPGARIALTFRATGQLKDDFIISQARVWLDIVPDKLEVPTQ